MKLIKFFIIIIFITLNLSCDIKDEGKGVIGYEKDNYKGGCFLFKAGTYEFLKYAGGIINQCEKYCENKDGLTKEISPINSFKIPPGFTVAIYTRFRDNEFFQILDKQVILKDKLREQEDKIKRYRADVPCIDSYDQEAMVISIMVSEYEFIGLKVAEKETLAIYSKLEAAKLKKEICLKQEQVEKAFTNKEAFSVKENIKNEFQRRKRLNIKIGSSNDIPLTETEMEKALNSLSKAESLTSNVKDENQKEVKLTDDTKGDIDEVRLRVLLDSELKEMTQEPSKDCSNEETELETLEGDLSKVMPMFKKVFGNVKISSKIYSDLNSIIYEKYNFNFKVSDYITKENLQKENLVKFMNDLALEYLKAKKERFEFLEKQLKLLENENTIKENEYYKLLHETLLKIVKEQLELIIYKREIPDEYLYSITNSPIEDVTDKITSEQCEAITIHKYSKHSDAILENKKNKARKRRFR